MKKHRIMSWCLLLLAALWGLSAQTSAQGMPLAGAPYGSPYGNSYGNPYGNEPYGSAYETQLPDWYPSAEERQNFKFFTDADAPRVVDRADILTDSEEAQLSWLIGSLSSQAEADIVVVTDDSDYGLGHMGYADDFYDYLGYGFGDTRDGILLFVCMDPYDRGFWTTATGRIEPLNDNTASTQLMDDVLYEYMHAGRYADGILNWVQQAAELCSYGVIAPPDWYPTLKEQESFTRFRDDRASRLVDEAGVLDSSKARELEEKAEAFSEQYDCDLVLVYDRVPAGMSLWDYAEGFYRYLGYGYHSSFDGVLALFDTATGGVALYTEGAPYEVVEKDDNYRLLVAVVQDNCYANDFGGAGTTLVKNLGTTMKTGRAPHSASAWFGQGVIASIIAAITAGIKTGSAKSGMKTVKKAYSADRYLQRDSFTVNSSSDNFLYATEDRVYDPPASSRTGGGGGGSSSHHSSSGSSHSGHGRSF